jgi:hypothetical protein
LNIALCCTVRSIGQSQRDKNKVTSRFIFLPLFFSATTTASHSNNDNKKKKKKNKNKEKKVIFACAPFSSSGPSIV